MIVVSGATVSTVKDRVAGRRVDVARRVARAHRERVGAVGERAERPRRRARRERPRGRPRTVQLALERRARPPTMNANDGDATFVGPVGPVVIVVSGATVSTVNERVAGVASVLPAGSMARTENVYAPSASAVYACGDVHAAYVPVAAPGPSSLHSNVAPASDVNPNDGEFTLINPVGPVVIVVSGATVSTVNDLVAGLASVLPEFVARTENV